MATQNQEHLDWIDSGPDAHEEAFYPPAKAPSLSYERKIRLHKYAENRARSSVDLLSRQSDMLWKIQETKGDVALFKPSSDWSEFVSAKAVVRAKATFPNVLKTVYDLNTSEKFKLFLRKVLGDTFLDAEVLEDLNGTGVYPSANPVKEAREVYKQASIKWWAIKSGNLASKSSDFYVLEYIGIETVSGDIKSCYMFQESLAEVGGMPQTPGLNLERSQFDALVCKFERLPSENYDEEDVMISVAFQRPPPMVSFFRSNPATEMVLQLARGLRDLLEDPPEPQEISVVKTSAWIKDNERQYCIICKRKFSTIFRRRHHCRTCGEVICWQCSSTIRVPSISFAHNDTGKQVLASHQSSIRVCTGCVVNHQRSKSSRELNNQEEFKEWIHKNKAEEQLAVVEGLMGNQRFHSVPQVVLHSPSHSQDLTGLHDEEEREARALLSRSLNEEQMRRQRTSLAKLNAEEEEKDEELHHAKGYSSDGGSSEGFRRSHRPRTSTPLRRTSGNNNQPPTRRASSSQRPSVPSRENSMYELRSSSFNNRTANNNNTNSNNNGGSSRVRRSQSEFVGGTRTSTPPPTRTSRTTLHPRQRVEPPPGSCRVSMTYADGGTRLSGQGRTSQQSAASSDAMMYSLDRRTGVSEKLLLQNTNSNVQTASAWATSRTETQAMTQAFQELLTKLSGDVHFLVIGFSTGFDAAIVVGLLRQLAPGVPYIGGTIARGMCDENAWVSVNRHNDEGLVTMFGINDPNGLYTVVHAEYSQSDAREKTYAAAKTALARSARDVDPGERPAFVAVYACPLFVEKSIDGIREAVNAPIVGGCSSDAAKQREGGVMDVSWIQISSGSSSDYTKTAKDGRGDWTEMGVAMALCYPSVETSVAWFSGYSPVGESGEYCMGVVTKASSKTIYEIDCKPAADVYHEWLEVASDKSQTEVSSIGFPRLGNLHPLGTTIDIVHDNQLMDSGPPSSASLHSMHSIDWSRLINMTAVITGINEDGSLSTTSSIAPGTNVVLMETSSKSLKTAINKMGAQAMASNKFQITETIGSLMFLSAGVQALLGHKSMAEMVGAYRKWSGGACLMGMTTFGEIGHLPNSTDFPHYDSLMFGAVIFSKRSRREYLYLDVDNE